MPHRDEIFDWDENNKEKARRHGVEPEEWEEAFLDPDQISYGAYDAMTEQRDGFTGAVWPSGRIITGIYTVREDRVRCVTGWEATDREKRRYRKG